MIRKKQITTIRIDVESISAQKDIAEMESKLKDRFGSLNNLRTHVLMEGYKRLLRDRELDDLSKIRSDIKVLISESELVTRLLLANMNTQFQLFAATDDVINGKKSAQDYINELDPHYLDTELSDDATPFNVSHIAEMRVANLDAIFGKLPNKGKK